MVRVRKHRKSYFTNRNIVDKAKKFSILVVRQSKVGNELLFHHALMFDGVHYLKATTLEELAQLIIHGGIIKVPNLAMCAPHMIIGLGNLPIDKEKENLNIRGSGRAGKYNFLTIEKIIKAKEPKEREKKKKSKKIITRLGELYLTFPRDTREDIFRNFNLDDVLKDIEDSDTPLVDESIDWGPITCETGAWHSILTRLQNFYLYGIDGLWFGFPLEFTPGSTGIAIEKILLPKNRVIPISGKATLKFIKDCFRGARVQSYCEPRLLEGHFVEIDLNGHYSNMGKLPLPIGVPHGGKPSIGDFLRDDRLSLVKCKVKIISTGDGIGPLPIRRNNKTEYPTEGVFKGTWTDVEIKAGRKHGKVEILEIFETLVWDKKGTFTRLFQNLTWLMMQKAPCKGIRNHVKLMRTHHHGKFSQSLKSETIYFGEGSKELENSWKALVPEEQLETGGSSSLNSVWSVETEVVRSYSMPHIGVFISSYGRVIQQNWMIKLISEGYGVLYTNNDSIWIDGEPKEEWMDPIKDGYFKIKQRADKLYIPYAYVVVPIKDGKVLAEGVVLPGMTADNLTEEDIKYHSLGHPEAIRAIQTVIRVKGSRVFKEKVLKVLRK